MTSVPQPALGAGEWQQASAQRADIYAWFSSVFALELDDAAVAAYRKGDADALLAAFAEMGLAQQATRVRDAVAAWEGIPLLKVELAADFARLFLADARDSAAPYASAYIDPNGQLYGEPHVQMQQFLRESGLQVRSTFKEPADHLAVALAFFEAQVRTEASEGGAGSDAGAIANADAAGANPMQAAAARQHAFLTFALLSWLPQFNQRCQQLSHQLQSDFYPALAALLLAFVTEDAAGLEGLGVAP